MPENKSEVTIQKEVPHFKRALGLWDLVFYGIVLITITAPLPIFGIISNQARGHVVTTILLAMVAMLFTAISYGRMASVYPLAGSAFSYVGRSISPSLGFLTGWGMTMDYMLNPILSTIWCSKALMNIIPQIPYPVCAVFFTLLFTSLNLRGIKTNARNNQTLVIILSIVVLIFFFYAFRYLINVPDLSSKQLIKPFYDPQTFSLPLVLTGTSIAALTYIGFDGISTLSEEVRNPRRNVLLATVLVCLITGVIASAEVYVSQLIWGDWGGFPDMDTAFTFVARKVGGNTLFHIINISLLFSCMGAGIGSMLGGARLLYGMGREDVIPKKYFGVLDSKRYIPRNNVLFIGATTLVGVFVLNYQLTAEMLNFGAFIAFMGVNLSVFFHFFIKEKRKNFINIVPPVLGFIFCFLIWINLRIQAQIAGSIWILIGMIVGFIKTKGFRKTITFSTTIDSELSN
ncbi:MAG: APC family permease [Bacteroidales bacterium]|nr:APC family permease [Bacteroidales bacterium]